MIQKPLTVNTLHEAAAWIGLHLGIEITPKRVLDFELMRISKIRKGHKWVSVIKAALPRTTISYIVDYADHYDQSSKLPGFVIKSEHQQAIFAELYPIHIFEILAYGDALIYSAEMEFNGYGKNVLVTDEFLKPISINAENLRLSDSSLLELLDVVKENLTAAIEKKLSPNQQDKFDFQAKAKRMWQDNPNQTRTEIKNSLSEYQRKFKGKNTLDNWLREIDQRPQNQRRGRPKKTPSQ